MTHAEANVKTTTMLESVTLTLSVDEVCALRAVLGRFAGEVDETYDTFIALADIMDDHGIKQKYALDYDGSPLRLKTIDQ